jgi:hypothetical protein
MVTKEDQFAAIWKHAVENYEGSTKKKLTSIPKVSSVDELVKSLDDNAKDFKTYREKNHAFFHVFSGALRPVELLGDLAAGGASMAFPPSSLIFGAVTYLIRPLKGCLPSTMRSAICSCLSRTLWFD